MIRFINEEAIIAVYKLNALAMFSQSPNTPRTMKQPNNLTMQSFPYTSLFFLLYAPSNLLNPSRPCPLQPLELKYSIPR